MRFVIFRKEEDVDVVEEVEERNWYEDGGLFFGL